MNNASASPFKLRLQSGGVRQASSIFDEVCQEWKNLWDQKIEDKIEAEAIARRDYDLLFTERGTVISATRDYKAPQLCEILEIYEKILGIRISPPDPKIGGWKKFSKDVIERLPRESRRQFGKRKTLRCPVNKSINASIKQGGRGWIHKF